MNRTNIGVNPSATYNGVCPANGTRIQRADVAAFRVICTGLDSTHFAIQPYDGFSSDIYVALAVPGSTTTALALTWNDLGAGAHPPAPQTRGGRDERGHTATPSPLPFSCAATDRSGTVRTRSARSVRGAAQG